MRATERPAYIRDKSRIWTTMMANALSVLLGSLDLVDPVHSCATVARHLVLVHFRVKFVPRPLPALVAAATESVSHGCGLARSFSP
ncbi:MAG: hypothetical protein DLM70_05335 [Chloroflexi bacterium]|nr:MAG: hypothetical protein DLM70_05335 [Chloroflexota bacterium]